MTVREGLNAFVGRREITLPAHIMLHLQQAVCCVECEVISDATGDVCPACGSKGTLLALSRVLGDRDKVTRVWAIPTADNASESHPSVKTAYSVEESDREPEPEHHV